MLYFLVISTATVKFYICYNSATDCDCAFEVKKYIIYLVLSTYVQVVCMNFFDIVLDFILMDAFEDLESPPSSVVAVLRNRWLSDSFKETVRMLFDTLLVFYLIEAMGQMIK